MDKYRNDSATYPDACKQDLQKQLSWIDSVLTSANEDWIIVAGHLPIYAETSKDDSEVWICRNVSIRYSASTR